MVSVLTGICGSTLLPYPNDGAETVNEVVGGYVLWDRCAARPAEEENDQHSAVSNEASSSKRFKLVESSTAIIPYTAGGVSEYFLDSSSGGDISPDEKEEQARDPNLLQYKDRNSWKGKGVWIFRKGAAEQEIAKGQIIFPSSSASVAGVLVGEENAGIIVLEVSNSVDPLVLQQELPNFTSGQPHLCRWPICSLRIEENGEILGDLYSAYEDADFVRMTQHPQAGPRKRPYFSIKRKLKTEEEKMSDRLKRKAEKKLLDADIRKDMIKGCSCRQRCCQSWSVEEVKEVRKEIYGVKFEKKLDLIYQKINASQGREDGLLLCYNGRFVCPTPRESTIHAEAFLKKILSEMNEPMPHLNFDNSNNNGTDSLYHRLPSCYDKQDIYAEHSIRMENRGGSKLSRGKFYDMWNKKFANFDFHKKSAFARCTECEKLKVWLTRDRNKETRKGYEVDRQKHLQLQMSGRSCYYSHNQLAIDEPSLYKSSIHDGMDSNKTAVPRLDNYVKALSGVGMPVPVKIAGILNRGHGPPSIAHVSIGGLWRSDPNFTVTSIAKYLRDCEDFDGDMRGDLAFEKELEHPLLNAFMNKDIFSKTVVGADSLLRREISSSESGLLDKPFNKLPPTFYIQLDNSSKDNKNWVMMAFFSELRLDRKSKTDFSVVPPPDQEPLSSGMASNHAATEDIITYLKAYIKHIKSIRDKTNPSSECYETDSSIIAYWENIKSLFEKPKGWATNAGLPLKEGFWPRTNHGTGYKQPGNQIILTSTPEDDILAQEAEEELAERNQLFVGNLAEMERERFVPIVDIVQGVMLLIRPSDDFVVKDCFWVAKAISGVIRQRKPSDPVSMYEVKVEWCRPKHRLSNATDAQRYNQCLRNTQEWEKDPSPFEKEFLYVNASACVHQWKSKSRSEKLKIPESILRIARDMLDRIAQEEI
ncbi:hypothetical protein R1sor_011473 [Riccia sorocarpa]|uniref:DUF7869 domain-containing protein n=1 Tax=Riccia sorocarpa TaxID=122646 RepID=A0ABD3I0Z1_9MARC